MAKSLVIFFATIILGCEINSKQIIKPEKFSFDIIKFDTVSKKLINNFQNQTPDHKIMSKLIDYWFDNRLKTNGFDGNLTLKVNEINFDRIKKEKYYKLSLLVSLEFIEEKSLNNKKSYKINSSEFGEITGSFSIQDQENLDINLMHQSLENISMKLLEID